MATEYLVLRLNPADVDGVRGGPAADIGTPDAWIPLDGTVEAHTPQAAIRAATDGKPAAERSGCFVAVPARSWKPLTRKVDTVEKDVWS